MSIYLRGVPMPKGTNLMLLLTPEGEVYEMGDLLGNDRLLEGASALPVPDHGDLIERDALRDEVKKHATPSDAWVFSLIRTATTIIPADKERSEEWLALCDPNCQQRNAFPNCFLCDIALEYKTAAKNSEGRMPTIIPAEEEQT